MTDSSRFNHPHGIPLPCVMHRVLDEKFVGKYDEILVIGDVHGCHDEMMKLLRRENALSESVLKIFVGDLVNKGPKSRQVIKRLINMKSTLSVRGNHDELVLKEYFASQDPYYRLKPGDEWMSTLSFEEVMFLHCLPYTISIPSLNSLVVHAGLFPWIPLEGMHPIDLITIRDIEVDQCSLDDTNSSEVFVTPWASLWPGPEHVYFGHDGTQEVQYYPCATGLDTGCVYGNKLSGCFISGPRQGKLVDINAFRVYCRDK